MNNQSESAKASSRAVQLLSRIAVAIFVPLLLICLVELGLRVFKVGNPMSATRPCTVDGAAAFCDNPAFTSAFFPRGTERTPRPYAILAKKPKNTVRIVILGESAAYGDPDPTYGFGRYLEVMLRENYPGIRFEIINTSITAINSHVVLPITKDLAKHNPDVFIVYAGNNEVVGPFGPGTALTRGGTSLPVIRAGIFLRCTRIGQLIAARFDPKQQQAQWRGMGMFLDRQVPASSPAMQHVYRNFTGNLRDIINTARSSGAQVIVSTIGTNVKDCAPFASMHRAGLSQETLRQWDELVQQGSIYEQSDNPPEALKLYQAAEKLDPDYAELQFRIARSLWKMGDYAGAKRYFFRAQDLDTLRFRADSQINATIRSVASGAGSGVELLDASAMFAKESDQAVPGRELFYEHVHMTPKGNYLLALALFPVVANKLPPQIRQLTQKPQELSESDCDKLLALTEFDRLRLANEMLSRLQKPPFTNQLNHTEQVEKMKANAAAPEENALDTAAQYKWAISKAPNDLLLHLNYAFFLSPLNSDSAEQEFRKAVPYDNPPYLSNWPR